MVIKFFGERGQAISIDAVIAITIFMVILAAIVTIWENQNMGEEKELILQDMKENGERTLNFLVRSAGEKSYDTTNLVGYWKFDEGSGITATDSASSNNGTLLPAAPNGPTWQTTSCHSGNCLSFDGVNDYVGLPALNLYSNNVTITAWVKRNSTQKDWAGIVFSRAGSTVAGISTRGTGELRYHWNDASNTYGWSSGLILPDSQWAFVALVITATIATIYRNSSSASNTVMHNIEEFNGETRIGQDPTGDRLFKGSIDEVKIYNRALTADEILQEYNLGAPNYRKTDWETTIDSACSDTNSLKFVGLAKRDRVIKPEKIVAFVKCADWAQSPEKYEKMKAKMLLNYDYYFRFLDKSGNIIEEPLGTRMVSGKNPNTTNPYAIIILKRAVNYESSNYNGEAIVELQIFKTK